MVSAINTYILTNVTELDIWCIYSVLHESQTLLFVIYIRNNAISLYDIIHLKGIMLAAL